MVIRVGSLLFCGKKRFCAEHFDSAAVRKPCPRYVIAFSGLASPDKLLPKSNCRLIKKKRIVASRADYGIGTSMLNQKAIPLQNILKRADEQFKSISLTNRSQFCLRILVSSHEIRIGRNFSHRRKAPVKNCFSAKLKQRLSRQSRGRKTALSRKYYLHFYRNPF